MSKLNSTVNARFVFENAKKMMTEQGVDASQAVLTQSDLRLEQASSLTKTQYQFPTLVNNNGPANTLFNTETRLNLQDAFVASAWGFFISKPASAIDTAYILHSYPSPVTFSTAGSALAKETLYNRNF